jgi:superfamily II DNA/RNA helicase
MNEQTFINLGLCSALVLGLEKAGIRMPTKVQSEVIPEALAGRDVIGQSATGTGKTLAFLLPIFQKIDPTKRETQAIVLAPTHELAMQIFREAQQLAENSSVPVTAAVIIGDVNIARQIDKMKERPHLVVGSSGRILELIQKRKINAQTVKTIVLDEADRLMDDNHRAAVTSIIKATQKDRQLLFFSATIPATALEKAAELTKTAVMVAIREVSAVPAEISHWFFLVETRDKIDFLRKLLASLKVERALVFINTSAAIEETVAKLCHHGVAATGIHGSSIKKDRQGAMESFRDGRARVLVASDLAARGLDITGVACVINLELPEDPQAYQHRAGRTGRAGATGLAVSIVDQAEEKRIQLLQKKLGISIAAKRLAFGKVID